MARNFTRADDDHLAASSAPVSAVPLTMVAWFNSVDIAASQDIISVADTDGANEEAFRLNCGGNAGGDPVRAVTSEGGSFPLAASTTGYSADTWHHGAAVFAANDDRRAFIDGGSKGTNTTSGTPSGIDRMSIGRTADASPSNHFDGDLAEVAIWDVALTDAEIAWLAVGYSPLTLVHRLGNLVLYKDLIRDVNRPYFGPTLTNNGTSVAVHTRVYYPAPSYTIPITVATAAAASLSFPQWNRQKRISLVR